MLAADADIAGARRALLKRTVREAGALALSMFRTEIKQWTKGKSSPVSEADIAVDDLIRSAPARGDAGLWLAVGGERRRRGAARQAAGLDRRSDRRHARLSRRTRGLVVSAALVEDATPRLAAVFAPATDEFFFAARGQGATRNDVPISDHRAIDLDIDRMAGPKPLVQRLATSPDESNFNRDRLAGAAAQPGRAGRLDAAFVGGNSRDWDLAAADFDRAGSGW